MIYLILSAVFFGMMPLFVTSACAGGSNIMTVLFLRFFLAIIPLFIYLKAKKISFAISKKDFIKIIPLSTLGYGITAMFLTLSYEYIPSGLATVIHFCYPVFVLLGSIVFLKQKVSRTNILCVLLCMGGIFLTSGSMSGESSFPGIAFAFISGITYSFYILYLEKSELQKRHDPLKIIFYMNMIAAPLIFIADIAIGELDLTLTGTAWIMAIIASLGSSFIGTCFFQKGSDMMGSQNASILSTFEPVTSVVVGLLILNEGISIKSILGCVLILTSVIIIAMKEKEA